MRLLSFVSLRSPPAAQVYAFCSLLMQITGYQDKHSKFEGTFKISYILNIHNCFWSFFYAGWTYHLLPDCLQAVSGKKE